MTVSADSAGDRTDFDLESGRQLPAWMLSVVMHATLFIAIGLLSPAGRTAAPGPPERVVGIALVANTVTNSTSYFQEAGSSGTASATATTSAPSASTAVSPPSPDNFKEPSGISLPVPGPGAAASGTAIGIPSAAGLLGGGDGRGSSPFGGQTRTEVFGASGQGNSFVYVFDRSSSMGGFNGRPLAAAKRELQTSVARLVSGNQFQVVFYNERPTIFNPFPPNPPKMYFATDENKQLAHEFAQKISPAGGTGHVEALEIALRMGPDVIFFLTDAGEPGLSDRQLADIRRKNRSASVINAIEFGSGPFPGGENFLKRLAVQNDGQYAYVDVTMLTSGM